MTPQARVQAAIDLLDEIIVGARDNGASADNIAKTFFKSRRYIGSKDRRAVREWTYRAIRQYGDMPESGRSAMLGLAQDDKDLASQFDGSHYGPAQIDDKEVVATGGMFPTWVTDKFDPVISSEEFEALLGRAPLDIRWHPEKTSRDEIFAEWPDAIFNPALPHAARLAAGSQIQQHPFMRSGTIEIQDWGSQAISQLAAIPKADLVIDLCAGAGGKTLALAAELPGTTQIIASDTDRRRLSRLEPRKTRAGANNIKAILLNPGKEAETLSDYKERADVVLIDAPCSGTGTWRRNPETRWRLTPQGLKKVVTQQKRILEFGSRLVKPGGSLVYAVCSLIREEGAGQISAFLNANTGWQVCDDTHKMGRRTKVDENYTGMLLSPYHDDTDGFFMTRLIKS